MPPTKEKAKDKPAKAPEAEQPKAEQDTAPETAADAGTPAEDDASGHRFGWKPSLVDLNDYAADTDGMGVDGFVDPRDDMPPCYDQLALGACTGNAIAGALEYDMILDETHYGTPSRLFIYFEERKREGTIESDAGAFGRDGFKTLRKIGAPPEEDWPYDISKFADEPDVAAYDAASEGQIKDYVHPGLGPKVSPLERMEAFKRVLTNRQTIAFGFTVYESFEQPWDAPGVMPRPKQGESVLGGHEVLCVGYIEEYPEHALCRNSWGTEWGEDGYFLMPWQYLCDPRYSGDWRSIYRPLGG